MKEHTESSKTLPSALGDLGVVPHQGACEHMKDRTACWQVLCVGALL